MIGDSLFALNDEDSKSKFIFLPENNLSLGGLKGQALVDAVGGNHAA